MLTKEDMKIRLKDIRDAYKAIRIMMETTVTGTTDIVYEKEIQDDKSTIIACDPYCTKNMGFLGIIEMRERVSTTGFNLVNLRGCSNSKNSCTVQFIFERRYPVN